MALLLCGCKTAPKVDWQVKVAAMRAAGTEAESFAGTGPAGIINPDYGAVLVLAGTNQTPCIVVKELTTGQMQTVGRFMHDRTVFGDSVYLDPGHAGAALDRPNGELLFSRNVSATNAYVIEHFQ
jgi:hypothetical protein